MTKALGNSAAWTLAWTEGRAERTADLDDGEALIAKAREMHSRAAKPRPVLWALRRGGASLSIAVGGTETVLTFEESDDGPYFISVGDPQRNGETEPFLQGGTIIDHFARNLVPTSDGFAALVDFVATGSRPQNLAWERL